MILFAASALAAAPQVTVNTSLGIVRGISEYGAESFKGIRYAHPPVGDQRFLKADLIQKRFEGEYDATKFRATCHQTYGYGDIDPAEFPDPESPPPNEDCLFLNIWRPPPKTHDNAALLPVLVWVHGGGFCIGSSSERWHNGTNLAANKNVVVVSMNYRLGPLGFLVDPKTGRGGMNGIRDQTVALRWISKHISAFSGDPSKVTVFGESAGGLATCVLSVTPLARGLIRRSIVQSGPCNGPEKGGWSPESTAYGIKGTQSLLQQYNLSDVEGLRKLPAHLIQWTNKTMSDNFFPGYFMDLDVVPALPADLFSNAGGKYPDALHVEAMIVGHTSKDGTSAFYGDAPFANATGEAVYEQAMRQAWGADSDAVLGRYPLARFGGSVSSAFIQANADQSVICPTHELAHTLTSRRQYQQGVDADERRRIGEKHVDERERKGVVPSALARVPAPVPAFVFNFAHFQDSGCDCGVGLDVVDPNTAASLHWASHDADTKYAFGTEWGPDPDGPPNRRIYCPYNGTGELALTDAVQGLWAAMASAEWPGAEKPARTSAELRYKKYSWPSYGGTSGSGSTQTLQFTAPGNDGGITLVDDYKKADCEFWKGLARGRGAGTGHWALTNPTTA